MAKMPFLNTISVTALITGLAVTVPTASTSAGSAKPLARASVSASSVKPNAVSALCDYTSKQPQLGTGDTGVAVKQAQCELNWAWANATEAGPIAVDGIFGTGTYYATTYFQECVGLTMDGEIGPLTWAKLNYWVNQSTYACNGSG
jgi:peptidoglycan hydrolase-like protein with peptidoglycan-binding domain